MNRSQRHVRPIFWVVLTILAVGVVAVVAALRALKHVDTIPRVDMEIASISSALKDYEGTYGRFPSGNARAIFESLRGSNPLERVFLNVQESSISPEGDLLDPWGTAYEVEVDVEEILVRSAGPNRVFGDSDDISLMDL